MAAESFRPLMRVSATTPITVTGCLSSGTMPEICLADGIFAGKSFARSRLRDECDVWDWRGRRR